MKGGIKRDEDLVQLKVRATDVGVVGHDLSLLTKARPIRQGSDRGCNRNHAMCDIAEVGVTGDSLFFAPKQFSSSCYYPLSNVMRSCLSA